MIDLVLDRTDPHAFEVLAAQLIPMIKRTVVPFARDGMLARIEDADSLTNLCLLKLHQAHQDFKYEEDLSEEHNERRFLAQVKTYITNILIDQQYSANLGIRKPPCGIVSATQLGPKQCDWDFEPNLSYILHDKRQDTPYQVAVGNETYQRLMEELGEDECDIAKLIIDNYTAEDVARKLGMKISRVRYLIYSQIQPRALECCV